LWHLEKRPMEIARREKGRELFSGIDFDSLIK
jgi:hypothetical protein